MEHVVMFGPVFLICGIVEAFWGYRLRYIFRFLFGLLAGALIGCLIGLLTIGRDGAAILGVVLGLFTGIISAVWEKVSVFIEFFTYGFAVTAALLGREYLSSWKFFFSIVLGKENELIVRVFVPAIIVGCIAGCIGLFVSRIWIIISTAFWGGILSIAGLRLSIALLSGNGFRGNALMIPIALDYLIGIVIIVAGMIYQFKTTGHSRKKERAVPYQARFQNGQPRQEPFGGQPWQSQFQGGQFQRAPFTATQDMPSSAPPQMAPGMEQPQVTPNEEPPELYQEKTLPSEQGGFDVRFCSECGNKIEPGEIFCPECGNKVR